METDDDDDEILVCTSLLMAGVCSAGVLMKTKKKSKHSVWVKPYISERHRHGAYSTLLPELALNDSCRYIQYLRMDVGTFEELLALVESKITKKTMKLW